MALLLGKMKVFKRQGPPLVIAHRGASIESDENTLAAFQKAIELNVDMIEFDVRQSKDHTPIIIHDDTLQRTTNGVGLVSSYRLKEIKKFQTLSKESLPTLEETLELVKNKISIFIELKDVSAKIIKNILTTYQSSFDFFIGSFSLELLKEFKYFNLIGIIEDSDLIDSFLKLNVKALALDYKIITSSLINALHKKNIAVFAWTVDNEKIAKDLTSKGVDGIITNDPRKIKECLKINA